MDLNRIKNLIAKYYEGETSLTEEEDLKTFFSTDIVPEEMRMEQLQFQFFVNAKTEKLEQKGFDISSLIDEKSDSGQVGEGSLKKLSLYVSGIAASLLIAVGVYYFCEGSSQGAKTIGYDTYDNPEEAYAETKRALMIVSTKFNIGAKEMNKISKFHEVQNQLTAKSE